MLRRLPVAARPLLEVLWQSSQARAAGGDAEGAAADLRELVERGEAVLPADSAALKAWREALAQRQTSGDK